jgi:hypothetical protein
MRVEIERGRNHRVESCPVIGTCLSSILLNKYRPNGSSVPMSPYKSQWKSVFPARQLMTPAILIAAFSRGETNPTYYFASGD